MKCNYRPYKSKLTKEEKELLSTLIAKHAFPIAFNRDYVKEAYGGNPIHKQEESEEVFNDFGRNEESSNDS